jgi:hypothetical protein
LEDNRGRDCGWGDFVCGDHANDGEAGFSAGAKCGAATVDFGQPLIDVRYAAAGGSGFSLKALYKPLRSD